MGKASFQTVKGDAQSLYRSRVHKHHWGNPQTLLCTGGEAPHSETSQPLSALGKALPQAWMMVLWNPRGVGTAATELIQKYPGHPLSHPAWRGAGLKAQICPRGARTCTRTRTPTFAHTRSHTHTHTRGGYGSSGQHLARGAGPSGYSGAPQASPRPLRRQRSAARPPPGGAARCRRGSAAGSSPRRALSSANRLNAAPGPARRPAQPRIPAPGPAPRSPRLIHTHLRASFPRKATPVPGGPLPATVPSATTSIAKRQLLPAEIQTLNQRLGSFRDGARLQPARHVRSGGRTGYFIVF